MSWNISKIFFSVLAYKILRAIVRFFSHLPQTSFCEAKVIHFQLHLIIKGLIFGIPCGIFLFLHDLRWLLQRIESIIFFIDGIYCWFFIFIQSRESIQLEIILWHLQYNNWTSSKANLLPFIDSKLFWYLFFSESKSSFILLHHFS